METRTIQQTKLFVLCLNPMIESVEMSVGLVASFERGKIIEFYNEMKCEPYLDGKWRKSFKKGSDLEWFNAVDNPNLDSNEHQYKHGIQEYFVNTDFDLTYLGIRIV